MKVCYMDIDTYQIGDTHNYDMDSDFKIGETVNVQSKEWEIIGVEVENHCIKVILK